MCVKKQRVKAIEVQGNTWPFFMLIGNYNNCCGVFVKFNLWEMYLYVTPTFPPRNVNTAYNLLMISKCDKRCYVKYIFT